MLFYIPVVSIVFSYFLVTGEVGRKSKSCQSYEVSKKGDEGKELCYTLLQCYV